MTEIKEKLCLQENFCRFFLPTRSNSQLITCPSCTRSNHRPGCENEAVWYQHCKWAAVRRGDVTGFFPGKLLLPKPKYQQNLLYTFYIHTFYIHTYFLVPFLMLGSSLKWSYESHHSLKTMLQFTAANPSLQSEELSSCRTWLCQTQAMVRENYGFRSALEVPFWESNLLRGHGRQLN